MVGIPRGRRGSEAQGSVITVERGLAARSRNPLEPIASIAGFLLAATAALTLLFAFITVFGSGNVSFMGLGPSAAPTVTVPVIEMRGDMKVYGWHVRPEVFAQPSGYRLDISAPDVAQRIWYTLAGLHHSSSTSAPCCWRASSSVGPDATASSPLLRHVACAVSHGSWSVARWWAWWSRRSPTTGYWPRW